MATPAEFTMTTGDVAKRLGVALSTVADWADAGELRCLRGPGRRSHRRFRPADVEAFAARMLAGGTRAAS